LIGVVLERLRGAFDPALNRLGRAMVSTGVPAAVWSGVGLALAIGSGLIFSELIFRSYQLAALLILVSGFMDVVDGLVARLSEKTSKRGAFLDSTLDRIGEVAIYAGIAVAGIVNPVIVILTLSASLLVSYIRARGESLNVNLRGVGIGERSERLLVLAILSIFNALETALYVVFFIATVTVAQRFIQMIRELK
jgi:archaetidylinositol phosphate synthase